MPDDQPDARTDEGERPAESDTATRSRVFPDLARRHRRTVVWVMSLTQVALAVLTAGAVIFAFNTFNANIGEGEKIDHMADAPKDVGGDGQPMNVLIMGSDSRDGAGNDIDGLTGGGGRSDTTILLHISGDRKSVYGVSIPRDAMVKRPDCRVDGDTVEGSDPVQFNTAFSVGGPQCTLQTVESITGVFIDHFLVLDFNGFKDMVDAVDGVQVCIPQDVDDDEHNIHFDAGTQELDGKQALNYVRERYVLSSTGDIGRMRRQQAFIASMTNKVMSADTLSRPDRVYAFLDAVTSSIKVDEGLDSVQKLYRFITQFQQTGLSRIKFVTVPIETYEPDPNRLQFAPDAKKLWKRIKNDSSLGKLLGEDSVSADEGVGTAPGDESSAGNGSGSPSTSPGDDGSGEGSGEGSADSEDRLAAGLCA